MTNRIVLADPSDLALLGLQSVLKNYLAFEVVETTRNAGELLEALPGLQPDVLGSVDILAKPNQGTAELHKA